MYQSCFAPRANDIRLECLLRWLMEHFARDNHGGRSYLRDETTVDTGEPVRLGGIGVEDVAHSENIDTEERSPGLRVHKVATDGRDPTGEGSDGVKPLVSGWCGGGVS